MKKTLFLLCIFILATTGCVGRKEPTKENESSVNVVSKSDVKNSQSSENQEGTINEFHPIILSWKDNEGVFSTAQALGGWKDNKWYHPEDFDISYKGKTMKENEYFEAKSQELDDLKNHEEKYGSIDLIKGKEKFKFYSASKFITDKTVKSSGVYAQWSTGDLMTGVNLETFKADEDFLIGVNGDWNALPRMMFHQIKDNTYLIDIEGDGKEETIRVEDFKPQKNEGEVGKRVYLERGDKRTLIDEKYVNPSYYSEEDRSKMELVDMRALDLNGDGNLELVIKVSHGYGVSITVHEIKGDNIKSVLGFYDGD